MNFKQLYKNKTLFLLWILLGTFITGYILTRPSIVIALGLSIGRNIAILLTFFVFVFLIFISWQEAKLKKQKFIFIFAKKESYALVTALLLFIFAKLLVFNIFPTIITNFLSYATVALFFTLSLSFLNGLFKKVDPKLKKISIFILVVLILSFIFIYTKLSFLALTGQSGVFDLGNMEQAVWGTLHGYFMRNTAGGLSSRLGGHFDIFLVLLTPFYAIWPSPKMLLFVQTLILGLGAWPLFLITRKLLKSSLAGLVFAFAYLISPILGAGALFDFHAVTLVAPFLFFAFYFLIEKRYFWYFVFIFLAITCKEEIAFLIFLLGIYVYLKHNKKLGIATSLTSLVWFLVIFFIIMPHFRQGADYLFLNRYSYLDYSSQTGFLKSLLLHPGAVIINLFKIQKLIYFLYLILPFGGLMLFSLFTILGFPSFAIYILSDNENILSGGFHYSVPLLFYLIMGSIYSIKFWLKKLKLHKSVLYSFLVFIFLSSIFFGYDFRFMRLGIQFDRPRFNIHTTVTEHNKKINEVKKLVPSNASVSVSLVSGVHFAARKDIYIFPLINNADYIVLEQPGWSWDVTNVNDLQKAINEVHKNKDYQVIYDNQDYFVAKKK